MRNCAVYATSRGGKGIEAARTARSARENPAARTTTNDQEEEGKMELTSDIQYLRRRRDELERRMRQPGGVRIIEERELLQIRQRLQDAPRPQERSAEMISVR